MGIDKSTQNYIPTFTTLSENWNQFRDKSDFSAEILMDLSKDLQEFQ